MWFGCIFLALHGWVWISLLLMTLYGIWILYPQNTHSWWLATGSLVYGLTMDSLLVKLGYMSFPPQSALLTPSPLWMGSFWFALSALLSGPVKWIVRFPFFAIIGGVIGGPFSYWGGAQMNALTFPSYWELSLGLLGLMWGISMWIYTQIIPHLHE